MGKRFYTEVEKNKDDNTWEVHYFKPELHSLGENAMWNVVSFKYEEHARLESSFYNAFYDNGRLRGTAENERVDVWEEIVQIMRERGIEN